MRHEREKDIDLLALVKASGGTNGDEIAGVWRVEYKPDSKPVDDLNFHIIRHKDMPGLLDLSDMASGTPKMCAKSSLERGINLEEFGAMADATLNKLKTVK